MACTAVSPPPEQHGVSAPAPTVPWFIKQETFLRPYAAMKPHLEAHRAWVAEQRAAGVVINSGYLVDGQGRPGGGGLLVLQAADYAAAVLLVQGDPMVCSGGVDWRLEAWQPAVGDLAVR
ncbi:MAG: hypothetical protein RLZZ611_1769 [Cyanobacteriota bacterium]